MGSVLKNYASMIAMVACVAAGGLVGYLWEDVALALKPVGDIFLNLLFVLVVPMVFFSVTLAFCKMHAGEGVGKTLTRTFVVFAVMWLIASMFALLTGLIFTPIGEGFEADGLGSLSAGQESSGAKAFVGALTVSDFPQLFSKFSLLPLIIFSAILGMGVSSAGEKGLAFHAFLESGCEVTVKAMGVLMKAGPVGLGCYFAGTIAELGSSLLQGYLRVFVVYCCCAAVFFFVFNPLLVFYRRGSRGVKAFFKSILPPSITALATSSSSAAMPQNIDAAKSVGISDSVAESIVPLSTNLLKPGSVMLDTFKICFLLLLTGQSIGTPLSILLCTGGAVLAALVSGAVTNGGVTGELLICSLLGVDPAFVGIIMIIGTICDIPATVVNAQSTVVAATLVERPASVSQTSGT